MDSLSNVTPEYIEELFDLDTSDDISFQKLRFIDESYNKYTNQKLAGIYSTLTDTKAHVYDQINADNVTSIYSKIKKWSLIFLLYILYVIIVVICFTSLTGFLKIKLDNIRIILTCVISLFVIFYSAKWLNV